MTLDDEGSIFLRNTRIRLRSDEASHPTMKESSTSTYQKDNKWLPQPPRSCDRIRSFTGYL